MKEHILIIEDEKAIQSVLYELLVDAGYEVSLAGDGLEGLMLFRAESFSLKLVLMRIEAVLRRIRGKTEDQKILSANGIELNTESRAVYRNGSPVSLTQLEFELLQTFLNHKNQVLTRDNLISQVWGYDFEGDEKTVNIHIMNLRRKLGVDCIRTIRGGL